MKKNISINTRSQRLYKNKTVYKEKKVALEEADDPLIY